MSHRSAKNKHLITALVTADILALGAAFTLAYLLRFKSGLPWLYTHTHSPLQFYSRLVFVFIPIWLLIFVGYRLYDLHYLLGGTQEYARVFNACTMGMMLVMVTTFLEPTFIISRGWLLLSWVFTTVCVGASRFILRRSVYELRRRSHLTIPTLIVGANEEAKTIAKQFQNSPSSGVKVIGFVDDHLPANARVTEEAKVIGQTDSIGSLVKEHAVDQVVVASSALSHSQIMDIFRTLGISDSIDIRLSPGLFEILTTGVTVNEIQSIPLVSVNKVRIIGMNAVLKSSLDYVLASVGLFLLSPLFLLVALLIKLDSPGPVFHKREVLGRGGKLFKALKFRTMIANADQFLLQNPHLREEYEQNFKLENDPRVTRVGKALRRMSFDELPQLMNVLKGEMSLVGPRMISPPEREKYGKWKLNLLTVKPGITGLWQVRGRSNLSYEDRVRLDMHYIGNYSIWLDLQLLFQTISAVVRGGGAY